MSGRIKGIARGSETEKDLLSQVLEIFTYQGYIYRRTEKSLLINIPVCILQRSVPDDQWLVVRRLY